MRFVFIFAASILLLTSCGRSDAKMQRKLTGVWIADLPNERQSRIVIHPDGRYECKLTTLTNDRVVGIEGVLRVKDGVLIDTITNISGDAHQADALAALPSVDHVFVVRLDDHAFVAKWEDMQTNITFRKVTR